jgi:hypothetical protein
VSLEAVLFDVGNTLLSVAEDPHVRALRGVAHLGSVPFEHYKKALAQAQREWVEAGGAPEIEDLPETWVRHITRALELAQFTGDCRHAARIMEESFLLDDGKFSRTQALCCGHFMAAVFEWVSCPIGRPVWS